MAMSNVRLSCHKEDPIVETLLFFFTLGVIALLSGGAMYLVGSHHGKRKALKAAEAAKRLASLPEPSGIVDRFRRAGFKVLDGFSSARVHMIGSIAFSVSKNGDCWNHSDAKPKQHIIFEVVSAGSSGNPTLATWREVGAVCMSCGNIFKASKLSEEGFFSPRLVHNSNIFDLLDAVESERDAKFSAEAASQVGESIRLLTERLEGLETLRERILLAKPEAPANPEAPTLEGRFRRIGFDVSEGGQASTDPLPGTICLIKLEEASECRTCNKAVQLTRLREFVRPSTASGGESAHEDVIDFCEACGTAHRLYPDTAGMAGALLRDCANVYDFLRSVETSKRADIVDVVRLRLEEELKVLERRVKAVRTLQAQSAGPV
jgi:hypothetical protein